MAFNYDIPVLELLDVLGCQPNPDYQPDPRLPALLNDFLGRAYNPPLFKTANIWTAHSDWTSYEVLEERIEEDREYYEEHPEELEEDAPTGWKQFAPNLTGYLKYVLCAILCGECYHTGQNVLEKAGWTYTAWEKPADAPMIPCICDLAVCCGYDPDTKTVLAILSDAQCKTCQITKGD